MRNLIILALLLMGVSAGATKYYISPTGSDGAAGTLAAPRASLKSVWGLVTTGAGDTIYLRGGTYLPTSEWYFGGKNDAKMINYPGELLS